MSSHLEDLRSIDPSPYGTPNWGSKIDAWKNRERERVSNDENRKRNLRERQSEIDNRNNDTTDTLRSLIRYLEHKESLKLKVNLQLFREKLIEIYDLPLLETYRAPYSERYEVEEKPFLYINIEETYSDYTNVRLTMFKLNTAITYPNRWNQFYKYENNIKIEDIQEIASNMDYDLSFLLRANRGESSHIKNYKPMVDFFLK